MKLDRGAQTLAFWSHLAEGRSREWLEFKFPAECHAGARRSTEIFGEKACGFCLTDGVTSAIFETKRQTEERERESESKTENQ